MNSVPKPSRRALSPAAAQGAAEAVPMLPALPGAWSLAALAASLAAPAAGAALWILYASQAQARLKRLGWAFLALALLGSILHSAVDGEGGLGSAERLIRPYD